MKAFIYVRACVLAVQHLFIFRGLVFGAAHNATLHVNFTIFKADIFETHALPLPPFASLVQQTKQTGGGTLIKAPAREPCLVLLPLWTC